MNFILPLCYNCIIGKELMYLNRLWLFTKQYIAWLIVFKLGHLFFLLYHNHSSFDHSWVIWIKSLIMASRLDLSMAGYIMIIPGLLYTLSFFFEQHTKKIIPIYHTIILCVYSLFLSIDLELYNEWGFRLDLTPVQYINTPGAMMASISFIDIIKHLLIAVLFFFVCYYFILKPLSKHANPHTITASLRKKTLHSVLFLLTLSLLIIPIRGSFGKSTINQSTVFFHESIFINHSCINLLWNIIHSAVYWDNNFADYQFMENKEANRIVDKLHNDFFPSGDILESSNPNIILIILESFGYRTSPLLGGNDSIAPNMNQLKREGIFFSNCFASGDRTNQAIPAILAGYPALPNQPILNSPKKVTSLPTIANELNKSGYKTGFYYGGEIDFAQINSLVRSSRFHKVISKPDVNSPITSSWGVPDHVMFEILLDNINKEKEHPFFKVLLTLSSHRPFDVPMDPVFTENSPWTPYDNAIFYTDKNLGEFIEKAKTKSWWHNTLIILLGDHGVTINNEPPYHVPAKFRIPMLWLGGALEKKDTIISKSCNQTDLAATLLESIHIPHPFRFSSNIFHPDFPGFSFYTYNNGFGFIHKEEAIVYSLIKEKTIIHKKDTYRSTEKKGKAYLQVLSNDYNMR